MTNPLARARDAFARLMLNKAVALLLCAAGLAVLYAMENQAASLPFAAGIVLSIAALAFLWSRKLLTSLYIGWLVVAALTVVSATKYVMKGFSLHFYDVVFLARDPELVRFLLSEFGYLIGPVALALAVAVFAFAAIPAREARSALPLRKRVVIAGLAFAILPATYPSEAAVERYFYYLQGRHASAFFVSLLDMPQLVSASALEERLSATPRQEPWADAVDCRDGHNRPDVFVVLGESQTLPSYFPQLGEAGQGTAALRFDDPALQPLSVETFGGGTWISNLSLLTGLSGADFGWRSPYLTITLENRVRGAIPDLFGRCGYRTAVIMPMKEAFVNEGAFLRSIGFETVLDQDAIGAPDYKMRDKYYFDAAERFIAEHRRTDGRPLFLEVMTMFPHSPYEERMEPELKVEGEPFHQEPAVNEYLRRLAIARMDLERFTAARRAEPGDRGSVVLEFGDHQSFVTKRFVDEIAGPDALADLGSLAYRTFYAVHAFGYELERDAPRFGSLDIAFLGSQLIQAAGLPTSPVFEDLTRLRDRCGGRFHGCADRAAVDAHLRRRVDSGLLSVAE